VLISAHVCHPSLCNDNLSAVAVAAVLAQLLDGITLHNSYRFVWAPGTIGAITWLALNEQVLPRIEHGLVLSCLGDTGPFTYKRSRRANAPIDRAVEYVLENGGEKFDLLDYAPYGYDERQYCSPGINLPVGCLMRTPNGKYPEYHTSADNLDFISARGLGDSISQLLRIVQVLESNHKYLNLNSKCEPQLGRRGLYRQTGGTDNSRFEAAMLWMLNLSDGDHSVLDIARRSQLEYSELAEAAGILVDHDLLRPLSMDDESSCH
jgi:aminopeptidase-like protein